MKQNVSWRKKIKNRIMEKERAELLQFGSWHKIFERLICCIVIKISLDQDDRSTFISGTGSQVT